jgi:UDP-N-acetylmuramate--alanine ligase
VSDEGFESEAAPVLSPFDAPAGSAPTLPVPDIRPWRRLHLVGIGGAGMRGIAQLLLARGVQITGSDLKQSAGLGALRHAGATVHVGHRADQVGTPDAVIISSAVPASNPEVREAAARGIPVFMRAQILAALMRGRRSIAVAGTHGKTTTTSMIAVMLTRLGLEPTFLIGGDLNESGSGAEAGDGELFVAEADESDGSFLLLEPEVGVVTNVEPDHLDFYGSRERVEEAFGSFCRNAGTLIACWDDEGVRRAAGGRTGATVRYGRNLDLDLTVGSIEAQGHSTHARVEVGGSRQTLDLHLAVPGCHNVLNALAALGVAATLDLPLKDAAEALGSFGGVRRRFDLKGSAGGATLVDDYAHHPTEVRATLAAAIASEATNGHGRSGKPGRLVAVFQPHRYSRTEVMWRELGTSLADADVVVLTDVYAAGEQPIPGVTGKLLVEALTEAAPGKRVVYLPRRTDVAPFLASLAREGDLILTLGAGDITMVGDETLARIRERLKEAR